MFTRANSLNGVACDSIMHIILKFNRKSACIVFYNNNLPLMFHLRQFKCQHEGTTVDRWPCPQRRGPYYTLFQKKRNISEVAFLLEKSVYEWIWGYADFLMTPGYRTLTLGPRKNPRRKVVFLLEKTVAESPMGIMSWERVLSASQLILQLLHHLLGSIGCRNSLCNPGWIDCQ